MGDLPVELVMESVPVTLQGVCRQTCSTNPTLRSRLTHTTNARLLISSTLKIYGKTSCSWEEGDKDSWSSRSRNEVDRDRGGADRDRVWAHEGRGRYRQVGANKGRSGADIDRVG